MVSLKHFTIISLPSIYVAIKTFDYNFIEENSRMFVSQFHIYNSRWLLL